MLMASGGMAAKLYYGANAYRVLISGDHVVCARSGARIPLDTLRYWSVARQEPYASAALSLEAEQAISASAE